MLSPRPARALARASPPLFTLPDAFGAVAESACAVCVRCVARLPVADGAAAALSLPGGAGSGAARASAEDAEALLRCTHACEPAGCGFLAFRSALPGHSAACSVVRVRCPYEDCSEELPRSELRMHLRRCPHSEISCADCRAPLKRMDVARHAAECPNRAVDCPWGCSATVRRSVLARHQPTCPGAWVHCPGCATKMRRRELLAHWEECPEMPEPCPECGRLVLRGQMEAHLTDAHRFTCGICGNEEPIDGSFQPDCNLAGHRFCFECTINHCRHKIESMPENSDERVTCPHVDGCRHELTPHQVEGFKRPHVNSSNATFQLEERHAEKYARILLFQLTRQEMPGFRVCPRGCGFGIELNDGATFLRCNSCKDEQGMPTIYCLAEGCGEAHDPRRLSCVEFRRQQREAEVGGADSLQALFDAGVFKRCPTAGCRIAAAGIQKNGECQHMTCPRDRQGCGSSFCWHCLAPHYPTVAHDASFHKRECILWQPQGSDAECCKPRAPGKERDGQFCELCVEGGNVSFCDGRPATECTRAGNGREEADDPRPEVTTHCACRHGCPCESVMQRLTRCQCGDARMPNACECGHSVVRCSGCRKDLCRLCDRPSHPGEPCLEDQDSPGLSVQLRKLAAQRGEGTAGGAAPVEVS